MSKEKFIVMLEWCESFEHLSNEEMGILFKKFISHTRGENVDCESRIVNAIWKLLQPNIDRMNNDYNSSVENGKKGGAPKGNSNAKKQPKNNLNQPNNNLNQPNDNPRTTYKEKEKEKDKEKDNIIADTSCSRELDRKKFYVENKSTIHHIMDLTNCSLEDAITLEIENQESISSVFG